ncbi:MAG: chromosomal replication initiator protein DnaA [Dorea sp.]|jgi:chromosomal replication initiator protein|nr:chromosomal replication initiator protein DnaA [Dorea sp.]
MNVVEEKWPDIIEHLRVEHELSNISFSTWIQPLKVFNVIDNTVYILVKMNASVDYIEKKYSLPLKVCIAEITGIEYNIIFLSEDDERMDELKKISIQSTKGKKTRSAAEKAGLNPKYIFDTFVVGNNNEFAHAASLAVSESPGEVYNPLFLYGGVGLGKTHLMHSIAHFILDYNPNKKVVYVTSETFTNELIHALKNGKESSMADFREKYRYNDVLLIDDIQFIIGKESTQEEFFHTFNHLHASGKQIIISSDRPPKDIETLEARLRTRFEWGLLADMSAPDFETRMAILQKKIELEHLEHYHIPNGVLEYIAENVKNNIRELEGALNKLIALYKLKSNNEEIDINLAAEAMKDIISSRNNREVTPELILDIVSDHFGVSISDLKSNKRSNEIVVPRQIIMYLCRKMTTVPLKSIGILLGGKNHSTIKHGIEKIEREFNEDEQLANSIEIIKKKISPL